MENHPDDHPHAIEAGEHAVDALRNGNLPHARMRLEEASAAVERARAGTNSVQAQRETAWDCYD